MFIRRIFWEQEPQRYLEIPKTQEIVRTKDFIHYYLKYVFVMHLMVHGCYCVKFIFKVSLMFALSFRRKRHCDGGDGASGRLHLQCCRQHQSRYFEWEHPFEQIFIQTNKTHMMIHMTPLKCPFVVMSICSCSSFQISNSRIGRIMRHKILLCAFKFIIIHLT